LSNGKAIMFLASQGRSKIEFTPNQIYQISMKLNPWRNSFYTNIGIEKSNLKTKIIIDDASISKLSSYQKAVHHITRTGLLLGIGSSVKSKTLNDKYTILEFGANYILQCLNINKNDYMTLNGQRIQSDSGFTLIDDKNISPNIRAYNQLYNYSDKVHELNFNFGVKRRINNLEIFATLDIRLSLNKIGNLYMDYYPGTQIIPGTQINEISGTAIGLKWGVSYPLF
jgi:hypothetical protein